MGLELEREKEERKDAELSVAAFKRQLASLKDKLTSVEADVEHYHTIVQNLRRGPSSSSTTSWLHLTLVQKSTKNAKR
jgi:kinetochore protein Spc25